jgi:putative IMPACT (imprinted ancient) family translation regulator
VVVVRYFGGVKLGVGGLISAYRTAAKFTLETADIIEKTVNVEFTLTFEYEHMDKVMRIIKDRKLKIVSQKMELNCVYNIVVRKKEANSIKTTFENLRCLLIK